VAILVTAVAAHLATIPVLAYRLGEFAPATIPTNVLISPMTMIGFSLAAIASMLGLISEEIGVAAAIPARAVSAGMLGIVERASRILPGNMTVGNVSGGSLVALMALCWGGVLLMSSDARTAFDRASGRLSGSSPEVRIALLSTPIVALVTIVAGMLAR
jgi:competence protein